MADPIPNDETEQNREDIKHVAILELTGYATSRDTLIVKATLLTRVRGKNFFAPIGDYPQKIIDLGTGTGTWAIEGESKLHIASRGYLF